MKSKATEVTTLVERGVKSFFFNKKMRFVRGIVAVMALCITIYVVLQVPKMLQTLRKINEAVGNMMSQIIQPAPLGQALVALMIAFVAIIGWAVIFNFFERRKSK